MYKCTYKKENRTNVKRELRPRDYSEIDVLARDERYRVKATE